MARFWEIATPTTWALLTFSSICFLVAFVLLSHALVRGKAYEEQWRGWTARGRLEWTVRGGIAFLLAGGLLWAIPLDAPAWALVLLGGAVLAAGGLQGFAMLRGKR